MRSRRTLLEVRRKGPKRTTKERILLVCEGEKTERIYFSQFLAALRAANVSLEIAKRECGSDPLGIIQYAKSLMRADAGIDRCYCIIDRDSHTNFHPAVREADEYNQSLKASRSFQTIKSYPCFEFWFILHFVFTRSPFSASGGKSAAECVIYSLRKYLPKYNKNGQDAIASLLDKTDVAICNAERAYGEAIASDNPNPSTEVHLLMKELKKYGI